jgi:pimeloyl-ACP methyl ester carboxylesterase
MRAPRLLTPIFCINSLRLFREMVPATGGTLPALGFALGHAATVVRNLFSPVLMARRVRLLASNHLEPEVAQVRVPALIITGQAELDRVVPVSLTRDYMRLWPHARTATIARSGHLGPITRPDAFADLVVQFAETTHQHEQSLLARSARLGPLCGTTSGRNSCNEPPSGPRRRVVG